MKIIQLTQGFIDYDKNVNKAKGSFGPYDKGREAVFEIYQNGNNKPIRVRFFISFLDRMANVTSPLDEDKLFGDAKKILEIHERKELKTKDLLYLYNFSTQEFYLLE